MRPLSKAEIDTVSLSFTNPGSSLPFTILGLSFIAFLLTFFPSFSSRSDNLSTFTSCHRTFGDTMTFNLYQIWYAKLNHYLSLALFPPHSSPLLFKILTFFFSNIPRLPLRLPPYPQLSTHATLMAFVATVRYWPCGIKFDACFSLSNTLIGVSVYMHHAEVVGGKPFSCYHLLSYKFKHDLNLRSLLGSSFSFSA